MDIGEFAQENKQFRAIDAAFADASFSTSLTLITLLRLSPVLPFAWANYVFGLSGVPFAAFSLGTFAVKPPPCMHSPCLHARCFHGACTAFTPAAPT